MQKNEKGAERNDVNLRLQPDLLESDKLASDLVLCFVDDAVGALADLLNLLKILHDARSRATTTSFLPPKHRLTELTAEAAGGSVGSSQ